MPARPPRSEIAPHRIGVFCPNWVGDVVMCTPAVRALRNRFPGAELVAVIRPPLADVLAGTTLVDRCLGLPHRTGLWGAGRWIHALRRERFDLTVLFPNSWRSAWWSYLSGASRRVGIGRNGRRGLLTDALAPPPRGVPTPALTEYLRVVAYLGGDATPRPMELATTDDDETRWHGFWKRQGLGHLPFGYVCLNPGGAFGAAKHWPTPHFVDLARKLAWKQGRTVFVLCGPAERETARDIARGADHPAVVSLAEETLSLGLTKAAIRHSSLLVTTDSGPRHFAPPFRVPVVTLFGPTHPRWSETFADQALHLQVPVPCGPCQQRTCPLGHQRCLEDLTPDAVYRAACHLLQTASHRAAA